LRPSGTISSVLNSPIFARAPSMNYADIYAGPLNASAIAKPSP
jgi:hypothetical protein